MRQIVPHSRLIALLFIVLAPARAQAQSSLLSSIKGQSFKGTHNSYAADISLNEQLDGYNVWQVELDLCGVDETSDHYVHVSHGGAILFCDDDRGRLIDFLAQIRESNAGQNRVTFVWLDIKNDLCCDWRGFSDSLQLSKVRSDVVAGLGGSSVALYRKADWDQDQKQWPSVSELLSRGKRFIVIWGNDPATGGFPDDYIEDDSVLFMSRSHTPNLSEASYVAFMNAADGELGDQFSGMTPRDPANRYLWRAYGLNDSNLWSSALHQGFQILSTDNYDASETYLPDVMPPHPFYVGPVHSGGRGTFRFPLGRSSLAQANSTLANGGILMLSGGSFPGAISFSRRMTVMRNPAASGTAVIGGN